MTILDLLDITSCNVYIRTDDNEILLTVKSSPYIERALSNEIKNAKIIELEPTVSGDSIIVTIEALGKEDKHD